jgi:hypothetical protein
MLAFKPISGSRLAAAGTGRAQPAGEVLTWEESVRQAAA